MATGNYASPAYKIGWLHAFIQGEGHVAFKESCSRRRVSVSNTEERLIDQFVEYCGEFDVTCRVYERKPVPPRKKQWTAVVHGIPNLRRLLEIGVGGGRKERTLRAAVESAKRFVVIDDAKMVQMLDAGASYYETAAALGCSRPYLTIYCRKQGYKLQERWPRPWAIKGRSIIDAADFERLRFDKGLTYKEIGERYGLTAGAASQRARRLGFAGTATEPVRVVKPGPKGGNVYDG